MGRPARSHPLTGKFVLAYCVVVADIFRAIADETRRAILDELTERDEQTLFELCNRLVSKHGLNPSRQGVSQHLDVLERAGLVRSERRGRYKFHYLNTEPLREIVRRWPIAGPADSPIENGGAPAENEE
jgi:DNA-binding transcriptional ArsR family regulator